MKTKFLAVLGLAAVAGLAGCRSSTNTNTAVTNTNTNTAVVTATPLPVNRTTETAATDPNLKATMEKDLKAKGFTDVTVDTTTTPATLRGTVAKGKLPELIAAAQAANGGKPVKNEVQEK